MLKVIDQQVTKPHAIPMAGDQLRLGLPANSYLTLVTSFRAFDRLRESWSDLESRCAKPPSVFQSYDWCRRWSDIYAAPDSANEIFIVAGYRQNRLVFIWPMVKRFSGGLNFLTWMTQPIGQYGDVLCDAQIDCEAWLETATAFIKDTGNADCLHLRHVRDNANFSSHAQRHWFDGKLNERAPMMDLSQFKTEADYDARYDAQQRRRRRRIQKKLEEIGPLKFEVLQDERAEAAIDAAIAEKLSWLQDKGRISEVLGSEQHAALLKSFLYETTGQLQTVVFHLTAGGRPVSWEIGFCYRGTHYAYLLSHQHELIDYSPGRLTLDFAERHALASGLSTFDLMAPYDPYKDSFSSGMVKVNDYYLPLSFIGAVYGHGYLGLLRPRLRAVYQNLPVPALRFVKRLLLR